MTGTGVAVKIAYSTVALTLGAALGLTAAGLWLFVSVSRRT